MKRSKIIIVLSVMMVAVICFGSCGSSGETRSSNETDNFPVKIEDIDWSVDAAVIDGEREVVLTYTNNSKNTIAAFEISFAEKEEITEEERAKVYDDLKKGLGITEEDLAEFEMVKDIPLSMYAEGEKVVGPGETSNRINCCYFEGYYNVTSIDHYALTEPDIAEIKYVDDNKLYTIYYDFKTKKYTQDSEISVAVQWAVGEIGNKIPKPDTVILEVGSEDETSFSFYAYGMTIEQFDTYAEACRQEGFTVNLNKSEGYYSAENEERYKLDLWYDENAGSMRGSIDAPEK